MCYLRDAQAYQAYFETAQQRETRQAKLLALARRVKRQSLAELPRYSAHTRIPKVRKSPASEPDALGRSDAPSSETKLSH